MGFNSGFKGLIVTAKLPDMQKLQIILFLFQNRLHLQSEVLLLLFTVLYLRLKPFDYTGFEVLEAITLYCTWSDNR